jgi:hypothetical protein
VTQQSSTAFTVVGTGFKAGESVTATLYSDPVVLGTKLADSSGRVEFSWTMPAGIATGSHTVILKGAESGQISISLTYGGALSATGANPLTEPFLLAGFLALLLGSLSLSARSRRRD